MPDLFLALIDKLSNAKNKRLPEKDAFILKDITFQQQDVVKNTTKEASIKRQDDLEKILGGLSSIFD
jgi:hypothetical protein